jgi:hypothetical protein
VLAIQPCSTSEFTAALALMKENMEPQLVSCGLSWDDGWHRHNYISKDNYSIFSSNGWIGFLSLEVRQDCLFINTLQLASNAQGSILGYRVYEWIRAKALSVNCSKLGCKSFKDSPVVSLYKRLGFEIVESEGFFCEMRLDVAD